MKTIILAQAPPPPPTPPPAPPTPAPPPTFDADGAVETVKENLEAMNTNWSQANSNAEESVRIAKEVEQLGPVGIAIFLLVFGTGIVSAFYFGRRTASRV